MSEIEKKPVNYFQPQELVAIRDALESEPLNWKTYHGDGQLTCIGPDGTPLPTVRLENFRDGLEDYAYAKILERMLKERETGNRERGKEDWVRRAREALAVPVEVMESMTNFTDSAEAVYRWRDEMADLIESISAKD